MSLSDDDDPFDDLELDADTLAQLDAPHAHQIPPPPQEQRNTSLSKRKILVPQTPPLPRRSILDASSSTTAAAAGAFDDPIEIESDDIWNDDAVLGQLDDIEQQQQQRPRNQHIPSSSSSTTSFAQPLRQRNLFGQTIQDHGTLLLSTQTTNKVPGARAAKRTKQWHNNPPTQRQPTASRNTRPPLSSSSSSYDDRTTQVTQGDPAPQTAHLPPDSMKLQLDLDAARKFTYPINMAKRDYQFNIVQRALFDNVLVALPTGLGKTFIAAVVILNFFNWYPQGKIVFVAPTKPLVAQQQAACHGICGLPWDVACEMTGNTTKNRRGDEWQQKRIFYMTPQTLDNDIRTGDVDPKDIICLVVDEAHRATGNYAYCQIVAQMQAVNPHFRILALTATPGSNSERVQEVIDNLHISLIELRTEEALDIRQYIHKKHEETMVVPLTDDFRYVRELYLELMQDNCEKLVTNGLLPNADPSTLHPFRIRSIFREKPDILAKKRWLGGIINETAKLAEARQHLDIFSVRMFRSRAQEVLDGYRKQEAKKMKLAQVLNLAASIPDQMHPKMAATIEIISEHFQKEEAAGNPNTKVMVFCSLRECVHEIVELLNASSQGMRASLFVGQAADRQGRGLRQSEQQDIIKKYKEGTFNVIVATSIGEEGLDIGEVDLIICYEAVKDSVRMLQRVGRTGRKRDGRIVVLMAEGPESLVWQRSKDTYKGVQQTITAGHSVTLFDDVPRLVPPSIKPVVSFEELDQPEFQPEMIGSRRAKAGKPTKAAAERSKKRKERHADASRNVPEGALVGFLKASSLKRQRNSMREGFDDDDDEEEENTGDVITPGTMSELVGGTSGCLSDDSDDRELERGFVFKDNQRQTDSGPSAAKTRPASGAQGKSDQVGHHLQRSGESATKGSQPRRLGIRRPGTKRSLAIEPSEHPDGSSPPPDASAPRRRLTAAKSISPPSSPTAAVAPIGRIPQPLAPSSDDEFDVSWSLDGSAFADLTQRLTNARPARQQDESADDGEVGGLRGQAHPLIAQLVAQERQSHGEPGPKTSTSSGEQRSGKLSSPPPESQESPMPVKTNRKAARAAIVIASSPPEGDDDVVMGPPAVPERRFRRGVRASTPNGGDGDASSAQSGSRVRKSKDADATGPAKKPKRRKKKIIGRSPTSKALFQLEAERDSDEDSRRRRRGRGRGVDDSDDEGISTDEADSSDREHVGDFVATQAPRGYNQTSVYQQSLLTQAAPSPFRRRTVGGFVGGRYGIQESPGTRAAYGRGGAGSSPRTGQGDEEDGYSLGSFVCEDDEEIVYGSEEDDGLDEDD